MILFEILTLLALLDTPAPAPAPAHSDSNRWAESTRGILAQRCGSCHLPNLPTSSKGALRVFNLAEDPWYGRLTHDQYEALLRRTRGTREITETDRATVESFVRCARDHDCPLAGP